MSPLLAPDPLAAPLKPERVNYATGVLLQAEDFQDEQTYHRGRLAMALRHIAGFGTIAGLRVRAPAAGNNDLELRIEPGVALDRYGRLIELSEAYCIRLANWFAAQETGKLRTAVHRAPNVDFPVAVVADIFLSAKDCARGMTPSVAAGPFDALDALVPARLAEEPQLELVLRAEADPIPSPVNHWPEAGATRDVKLAAVLGSWDSGLTGAADEDLDPLPEQVPGTDLSAVLLARVAIPVQLAADAPSDVRPAIDAARPSVDNRVRPFIFLPGKWHGRAPAAGPLVEP